MFSMFQLLVMALFAVLGMAIAGAVLKFAIQRTQAPAGDATMDGFAGATMARVVPMGATLSAAIVGAPLGFAVEQFIERNNRIPVDTADTIRLMSLVAGSGALVVATALAMGAIGVYLALANPDLRARAPWLPLAAFFSAGIGLLLGGAALRVIVDYGGFSAFSL